MMYSDFRQNCHLAMHNKPIDAPCDIMCNTEFLKCYNKDVITMRDVLIAMFKDLPSLDDEIAYAPGCLIEDLQDLPSSHCSRCRATHIYDGAPDDEHISCQLHLIMAYAILLSNTLGTSYMSGEVNPLFTCKMEDGRFVVGNLELSTWLGLRVAMFQVDEAQLEQYVDALESIKSSTLLYKNTNRIKYIARKHNVSQSQLLEMAKMITERTRCDLIDIGDINNGLPFGHVCKVIEW